MKKLENKWKGMTDLEKKSMNTYLQFAFSFSILVFSLICFAIDIYLEYHARRKVLQGEYFNASKQYQKELLAFRRSRSENPEMDIQVVSMNSSQYTKKTQSLVKAGHNANIGGEVEGVMERPQNRNMDTKVGDVYNNTKSLIVGVSTDTQSTQGEIGLGSQSTTVNGIAPANGYNNNAKRVLAPPAQPGRDSPQSARWMSKLKYAQLVFSETNRASSKRSHDNISCPERPKYGNRKEGSEIVGYDDESKQSKTAGTTSDSIICVDIDDGSLGEDGANHGCVLDNSSDDVKKRSTPRNDEGSNCKTPSELHVCVMNNINRDAKGIATYIRNEENVMNESRRGTGPNDVFRPFSKQSRRTNYPISCPVWFNMQYSKPCSSYLEADKGIVTSVSLDSVSQKMVYEVERKGAKSIAFVAEDELAFAVHCPVLVRMESGKNSEIEGEITNVMPVVEKHGKKKILYTVMVIKEGRHLVGQFDAERIRYKMSLEAHQSRIRKIIPSSRKRRAVGIRSNERGEPIMNKSPPVLKLARPPVIMTHSYHIESSYDGSSSNEEESSSTDREEEMLPSHAGKKLNQVMLSSDNILDPSINNMRKKKKKKGRYVGVICRKAGFLFEARVCVNSKSYVLGHYRYEAQAALAYDVGARMKKRPRSNFNCNFPNGKEDFVRAIVLEMRNDAGQSMTAEESFNAVLTMVKAKVSNASPLGEPNRSNEIGHCESTHR